MNARTIAAHAGVAALPTIVWEVGIHLPAGDPGTVLRLVGFAPFLLAGLLLAVGADARRRAEPVPAPRTRGPQPVRKELAR
ncbi:hypothetical protein CO540_13430 [Micromonospora sp. WMMA2032]|uniref:hypothetical protein n=1 Tax=Micromonospora sp. WMMA2032 TaxID=2039870 RepID=UPI000C059937|nr:hypothetical protein [Micromonospora sp. WMMA2032]ATO14709.1 hypothetical protein CO540_13430 [Micromonospora sp. WMMA2032]